MSVKTRSFFARAVDEGECRGLLVGLQWFGGSLVEDKWESSSTSKNQAAKAWGCLIAIGPPPTPGTVAHARTKALATGLARLSTG